MKLTELFLAEIMDGRLDDLRSLPAEHLAQDQHRPLPRWQGLQGGDEGQPHGVLEDGALGWVCL